MDRRKDTPGKGTKLPSELIKMISDIFNKNFKSKFRKEGGKSEKFIALGEIFPDEVVLCVSLENPTTMRMVTCYASADYPPKTHRDAKGALKGSASDAVQECINHCVDGVASFFTQFFDDERPLDYDTEYRQGWTEVELDPKVKIHMSINRDNPHLEAQADAFLEAHEGKSEKASDKTTKKKSSKGKLH